MGPGLKMKYRAPTVKKMEAVKAYTVHSKRMRLSGGLASPYMRYFMAVLYQ